MYFDRNATQNEPKASGSGGMDRPPNAARLCPQAASSPQARVFPDGLSSGGFRRRGGAIVVLWLVGAAPGCAARGPAALPTPLTELEAVRLLEATVDLAGGVRRYQAVVAVRGESQRGRFSGRLLVVFARPVEREDSEGVDALRLELFAPVGGSRWTLVAGGSRVRLVVPGERAYAEGTDLEEFTDLLLGVPVGLRQIAALLVGSGTPLGGREGIRSLSAGGSVILDGGAEVWWDSAEADAQVRRVSTGQYEARYPGDYRRQGRQVPRTVRVSSERVKATLTVEELEVNARLHADSFRVRIPAGYRRAALRELSRTSRLPEP